MQFLLKLLAFLIAFLAVGAIITSHHRWRMPSPKYGDLQFNWINMSAVWRTVDAVRYFRVVDLIRETHVATDRLAGIRGRIIAVEIEDEVTTDRYTVEIPQDIDVDGITKYNLNAKQKGIA